MATKPLAGGWTIGIALNKYSKNRSAIILKDHNPDASSGTGALTFSPPGVINL